MSQMGSAEQVRLASRRVERVYGVLARVYDDFFDWALGPGRRYAVSRLDARPGDRVLEVGVGTGLSLPLYPQGCEVVGVDISIPMLDRARRRVASLGRDGIRVERMDARALGYPDGHFDRVLAPYVISVVPDPVPVMLEIARVCRPGGRIALASWTPDGFIGETFRVFSRYLPPAPGLQPPVRWGDERYLGSLFSDVAASMTSHRRTAVFRFRSAEETVDFFRTHYGPTLRAFESLDPPRRESLRSDLVALARRHDRNGGTGPIAITGDYLETVIVRR